MEIWPLFGQRSKVSTFLRCQTDKNVSIFNGQKQRNLKLFQGSVKFSKLHKYSKSTILIIYLK